MAELNSETKITMTIGKFFALIGTIITTMLGMFVGFYFMAFQPKVDSEINNLKEFYSTMQAKDIELIKKELEPYIAKQTVIEGKLTTIETKVDGISGRFNDLNKLQAQQNNSGGLSN